MKKFFTKLADSAKNQKVIIKNNYKEIDEANLSMLSLILIVACIAFFAYTLISLASEEYNDVTVSYMVILVYLLAMLIFHKKLHRVLAASTILYIVYFPVMLFSFYVCGFLAPDYPSITALLFFFQIPFIILDHSWKINSFELVYMLSFIVFIVPLKEPSLILDEVLNSILFSILAMTFGEYLRNSKLENFELKRQALIREQIDMLTGLENRRYLFLRLAEIEAQRQNIQSAGILMIDIDYFKLFNDTYGHQAGDDCLQQIGNCFLQYGQKHQLQFYRYGGEEFVCIAVNYSHQQLQTIGKEIIKAVAGLNITHKETDRGFVTISMGMSLWDKTDTMELNRLISYADAALYAAKANGKNRLEVYSSELSGSLIIKRIDPSFREI